MTDKEYKLECENSKLKKKIKELENKNKDLEIEKNIKKQIEDCERIYRRLRETK